MSEVKRYDISCFGGMSMDECNDGAYVNYEDYAALESKLAQLINENIKLKSGISGLIHLGIRYADVDVMKIAADAQLSTPCTDSIINSIVAGRYLKDGGEPNSNMACDTTNQQFESLAKSE